MARSRGRCGRRRLCRPLRLSARLLVLTAVMTAMVAIHVTPAVTAPAMVRIEPRLTMP